MVTKEQKQVTVTELAEQIRGASSLYFVDFTGMSVKEDQAFRAEILEKGATMRVAKNTLIKRALNAVGDVYEGIEQFKGQTAIIFSTDDAIGPAKVIRKHFDKTQRPGLKLAFIEGQTFDGSQLKQVAEFPSREELMASIVGSINAPVSGIHGAISAVMRDVASLVEEVAKKQAA